MKRSSFLWAFVLPFLSVSVLSTSSYARTWLVRQDGSGDCTTVQSCIDAAEPGDTVLVGPGVYAEDIHIFGKTNLVLAGESGPATTTLQAQAPSSTAIMVNNCTGDIVIERLAIAHSYSIMGSGGIDCVNSTLAVRDNVIFDCHSAGIEGQDGAGGGIGVWGGSGVIIERNSIWKCGVGLGGNGGGILASDVSNLTIRDNIVAGCTGGGGIYAYSCPNILVLCNDVWNNMPFNYTGTMADQTGLNGNISVDPMFCDAASWNLLLHSDSPCLNAPGCGRIGALGAGCGPTAVQESSWGKIKTLFR